MLDDRDKLIATVKSIIPCWDIRDTKAWQYSDSIELLDKSGRAVVKIETHRDYKEVEIPFVLWGKRYRFLDCYKDALVKKILVTVKVGNDDASVDMWDDDKDFKYFEDVIQSIKEQYFKIKEQRLQENLIKLKEEKCKNL
jgi:hypothetical protein